MFLFAISLKMIIPLLILTLRAIVNVLLPQQSAILQEIKGEGVFKSFFS